MWFCTEWEMSPISYIGITLVRGFLVASGLCQFIRVAFLELDLCFVLLCLIFCYLDPCLVYLPACLLGVYLSASWSCGLCTGFLTIEHWSVVVVWLHHLRFSPAPAVLLTPAMTELKENPCVMWVCLACHGHGSHFKIIKIMPFCLRLSTCEYREQNMHHNTGFQNSRTVELQRPQEYVNLHGCMNLLGRLLSSRLICYLFLVHALWVIWGGIYKGFFAFFGSLSQSSKFPLR